MKMEKARAEARAFFRHQCVKPSARAYQALVPISPLKGPTTSDVIQPP